MTQTSRLAGLPLVRWILLALLGASVVPVQANIELLAHSMYCVDAIVDIYGDFYFVGVGYDDYYGTLCSNPLAVQSLYAAGKTYCTTKEFDSGFKMLASYCTDYGETTMLPVSMFTANLTPAAIAALPVYPMNTLNETDNQTAAFLPDKQWFSLALRTETIQENEQYLESYYGYGVYGFWGGVLLFGMIQNLVRRLLEHKRGWVDVDAEGGNGMARPVPTPAVLRPFVPLYAMVRKYFVMPALVSKYHQRKLWGCTMPTRAETFVVTAFWIYSLITCCINYHAFQGNLDWANIAPQLWNHIAWRTGTESYFLLPLIWMFSGRNNVFLWLTGWQFSTFNVFHRHIARISTLEGIMHSIGWSAYFFAADYASYYYSDFKIKYFYMGAGGTVVMSLLIFFSFSFFRTRFYESFLLIHIIFSVLLIMFLWYHTDVFDMDEYNYPFILPPIVIWSFDRLMRLVRQVWCNLHVGLGGSKTLQHASRTAISYNPATTMLTIDIIPGNARLRPAPGQHYYLYQPYRFLGWENHPFTLSHWYRDGADDDRLHLVFSVRAYDGWTKTLRRQCEAAGVASADAAAVAAGTAASTNAIAPRMILEGPYGKSEPLHTFDQVLLIAGGSGIAAVLPYVLDYIRRTDQAQETGEQGSSRRPTRTHRVTLVWTDRRAAAINRLASGALAPALARDDIHVHLHQTLSASVDPQVPTTQVSSTSASSTDDVSASASGAASGAASPVDNEKMAVDSSAEKSVQKAKQQVHIQSGRPDIAALIRAEAESVYGTGGRLAVMACGPATLADSARHATAQAMESSKDSIEYFEENFGW